jgi:hypothetical protein
MASSSRRDGAGGKGVGSGAPRAGGKKRAKRETGVITVKRAGVLPRQARAPRVAVVEAAAAPELATALEEITQVTLLAPAAEPVTGALPQAVVDDDTEEMSLEELVRLTTAELPAPAAQVTAPEEGAPSLADVVMPPLEVEPPPAPAAEPEPAAALPASPPARTGLGRLMSTLRRWAGPSAPG